MNFKYEKWNSIQVSLSKEGQIQGTLPVNSRRLYVSRKLCFKVLICKLLDLLKKVKDGRKQTHL